MAHIARNRVMELSTSTGVGSFVVSGSIAGHRTFSSVASVSDTFWGYIEAVDANGVPTGDWEDGLYTYSALNTIARTTVRDSSNGGAAVNFSAGNKIVAMGVFAPQDATTKGEWRSLLGAAGSGANSDITSTSALASMTGLSTVAGLNSVNGGPIAGRKNPIINGAFSINQRLAASNADDTYAHDRWYALTQTGAIALSTLTDQESSTPFMARLTQSQASAQRMGYAQIIEGKDCKHLRGKQVTFRFGRKRLSSAANVRIAVLEWTGTEDSVTSDVVLDWTSGAYTAGNFFLATNLTVSAVVQQALAAATLTDGSSVTATLGSTFNNLIVFVWTEATVAQNVTLDLAKAQIDIGGVASVFETADFGQELLACQRYYSKSYDLATAPLTATSLGCEQHRAAGSTLHCTATRFKATMRAAPSVTVYTTVASVTANSVRDTSGSANLSISSINNIGASGFSGLTAGVAFTATNALEFQYVADAEL